MKLIMLTNSTALKLNCCSWRNGCLICWPSEDSQSLHFLASAATEICGKGDPRRYCAFVPPLFTNGDAINAEHSISSKEELSSVSLSGPDTDRSYLSLQPGE